MKRDVISMLDLEDVLPEVLQLAKDLKKGKYANEQPLRGKKLAMIFEKSSTRTRVSFEVGMLELGGHALNLSMKDLQLGRGETVADTAKVLSRYVDGIMYRAYQHEMMLDLAKNASVPVINALDNFEHPCQILADLLTVIEYKKQLKGKKMTYVGDGNNVCNSLMLGCAMSGMHFVAACPNGYDPDLGLTKKALALAKNYKGTVEIIEDPMEAAKDADVVYTDVWVSMGQEAEANAREKLFMPYQINSAMMAKAKKDAIAMHCLPAHRGMEISAEVMDGPQSVVFDQAENRLHVQKALMMLVLGGKK
ncbi:MAG: Ornithine carbamoyltransferase [Methanomassiliicoccales archaeon PtaU1.Bin124]|nr:MAG: Ornithine carbamoyltransferase [Methanomassiliicoccales archaeon PtaU1.Bin124]